MYSSDWYQNLIKPPFAPPDAVFAPAWSLLYLTIFAALIVYIVKPGGNKKAGYIYFTLQLALNLAWSPVFFIAHSIFAAFLIIILLDIFALLAANKFYKVSKTAGLLLLPYLFWLIYASYLNFGYLILNR